MKKNKEKIIIILITAVILITCLIIFLILNNLQHSEQDKIEIKAYVEQLENGNYKNCSSKLAEKKQFNNFEFSMRINKTDKVTMNLDVRNMKDETRNNESIEVIFKEENGETIGSMITNIDEIEAEKSITLGTNLDDKYINTYDFEIREPQIIENE